MCLLLEGVLVGGYLAGECAALIAVGPLKERVNHEVNSEDTKREKYVERHLCFPRTDGALLQLD